MEVEICAAMFGVRLWLTSRRHRVLLKLSKMHSNRQSRGAEVRCCLLNRLELAVAQLA